MLLSLLQKFPAPIILHQQNGKIILANKSFTYLFGTCADCGENFYTVAGDARVRGISEQATRTDSVQGAEIPLTLGGKNYFVQYLAVPMKKNHIVSILIDDTLRIESLIAHVRQLRKSAYDHTWILSDNSPPTVVWASIGSEHCQKDLGMVAEKLVFKGDEGKINECLHNAKSSPGKLCSVAVRPAENPDQTIDIDIVYYPTVYLLGHYIASSHVRKPSSSQVIDRLKNAFMVETDTELAEALEIPPSAITRAKKQKMPPLSWLEKAFRIKGVSMDWLLGAKGSKFIDR